MGSLDDLHSFVLALPETSEGTHHHLSPAYSISGKPFIVIEKDRVHVLMRLNPQAVQSLVNEDPATYEEVWRMRKHLIGIKFALAKVSAKKLHQIVELSWRTMASKKLIQSFDETQR
jgi:hypothetical protein